MLCHMLTADYIASLPDELVGLYSDVETEILESVVSRIQKTKALTPASVYQLEKLRDLGRLNSDVTKILAKALGVSQKQVKRMMQEAGVEALSVDDAIYRSAGKTPIAVAKSAALREVLAAGIKKTNGLFKNFTGTTATTARMAYSNILDKAYLEVTSGAYSYQEAIRRAVKTLSKQGITKVAYPTGGQDTIETSVRKCVVTGVNQTVGGLQLARAKEMDSDLVEVSAHAGARPSHAEWQGGIYSISGKNPHYGSLYAITGYGTIEGLCGINCYHSFYPYFEGLSSPSFERDPARRLGKTNDQVYEENQHQRVYERRVRESRRECATLDEAMANAESEDDRAFFKREFDKASVLLKKRESSLHAYCDSIGRRVETDRLTVGGFGRSVSSKAVWANRNATGFTIGHSLGAKARNYDVVDKKSGIVYTFVEGSRVKNPKAFAGAGTSKPLGEATVSGLVKEFGGDPAKWKHCKGIGTLADGDEEYLAEVHWFEEPNAGKVKFKVKEWLDE